MSNYVFFIREYYFVLVVLLVGIIALIISSKSSRMKKELVSKIGSYNFIALTERECIQYQDLADSVLNNTTVTFSQENDENPDHKLYSETVQLGNNLLRLEKFNISDTGEI